MIDDASVVAEGGGCAVVAVDGEHVAYLPPEGELDGTELHVRGESVGTVVDHGETAGGTVVVLAEKPDRGDA